jgi:hypothetical protein
LLNKRAGVTEAIGFTAAAPDKSGQEPNEPFLIMVPLTALPQLKFKDADALTSSLLGETVLVSGLVSEFTQMNPRPGVFRVIPIPSVRIDKDAKLERLPK